MTQGEPGWLRLEEVFSFHDLTIARYCAASALTFNHLRPQNPPTIATSKSQ